MAIAVKRLSQIGHPIHDGLAIEDDRGIAVDAVLHRLGQTYCSFLDRCHAGIIKLLDPAERFSLCCFRVSCKAF